VPIAMDVFDAAMPQPNQIDRKREDVQVTAADLLAVPEGTITEAGLRLNLSVGVQYLAAWLGGSGAVPINNLMEDAATAEIARSQIWQWRTHGHISADQVRDAAGDADGPARELFEATALADELPEFLTLPAYERLP